MKHVRVAAEEVHSVDRRHRRTRGKSYVRGLQRADEGGVCKKQMLEAKGRD